jgi:hypothetical protein
MDDESTRLARVIESVADGDVVDWPRLQGVSDASLQRLLADLEIIARIADVHRSGRDDPFPDRAEQIAGTLGAWGPLLLIRKLSEGAFGEVYEARHPLLDHSYALKLVKSPLVETDRALQEARRLVKLRHPNVVAVHGADVVEGRVGFWMDLIDGHTLSDVVAREGLRNAGEAAVIGQDLCRALAAVHGAGIVHRDIKAQNVMRESSSGRIVLVDFGAGEPIAAARSGRIRRAGTPLYLAPELFEDGSATVGTDIYALGVLLFYLVTGAFPVAGNDLDELTRAHARGERQHLGDLRPDLPDGFVEVVDRMLARDPAARYASAGSARAGLESVVGPPSSIVVIDHTGGVEPPAHDWSRRLLAAATFIAGGAAICTFAGFAASMLYNTPLGRVDGFEAESPWSWPVWGLRTMISAAIVMALAGVVWLTVSIGCRALAPVLAPARSLRRSLHAVSDGVRTFWSRPVTEIAPVVMIAQIALLALFAFAFRDLLAALDSFISQRLPVDLSPLRPTNQTEHIRFDVSACLQVLLFGLAWQQLWRRRERPLPGETRAILVCGIAIAAATLVVAEVIPFRILYHNDAERVSYQGAQCYIVGARGSELRLFCPLQPPPWDRVVRVDDARLRRDGVFENIFSSVTGK